MIKKLYVGDVTEYLADFVKQNEPDAFLVADKNFTLNATCVYTSLGDLCLKNFIQILTNSSEIFYVAPKKWSDKKSATDEYSQAWITEKYLHYVKNKKLGKVYGLPEYKPDYVHDQIKRQNANPQIWVAGCSTSAGVGVEKNEMYSHLISQHLNMPVTNLAVSGSSNLYQAQLLCQSDIQPEDIVVFGLTNKARLRYIIDGNQKNINPNFYNTYPDVNKIVPLDYFDSEQRVFESITAIQMVQNFCKQIKAKLVLIGLHLEIDVSSLISYYNNYIMVHGTNGLNLADNFLDLGNDGSHPGPLTHQHYAKLILEKLFSLNYINGEKNGTLS